MIPVLFLCAEPDRPGPIHHSGLLLMAHLVISPATRAKSRGGWRRKMGGTPLSRSTSHLDVSVLVQIECELVRVPVVSVSVTGLGLLLGGLLHHECFGGQQQ